MGFPILVRCHLYIESRPCWWRHNRLLMTSQWPTIVMRTRENWYLIRRVSILFTTIFTLGRVKYSYVIRNKSQISSWWRWYISDKFSLQLITWMNERPRSDLALFVKWMPLLSLSNHIAMILLCRGSRDTSHNLSPNIKIHHSNTGNNLRFVRDCWIAANDLW